MTHFAEAKLSHLSEGGGCLAADAYPGASSGTRGIGQARNEHSGYRSAGGALAQHSALLLRNARAARYKQHKPGPTKFAPFESCLLSRVASARPTLNSGDGVTARVARARLCGRHQLAQGVSGVAQARRTRACGEVRNRTGQTNAGRLHGHSMRTRAAAGTLT
jgi:hypothetical protein